MITVPMIMFFYDNMDGNDDNDVDDDEKPGLVAQAWLPLTGWPGKKRTVHALSASSSSSSSLSSSLSSALSSLSPLSSSLSLLLSS